MISISTVSRFTRNPEVPDSLNGDTSYFPDEELPGAEKVLRAYGKDACELVMVGLTELEVVNGVLLARRTDRITRETADRIVRNFRALNLRAVSAAGLQDVYHFGRTYSFTAYDARYVAPAIKEEVPLVTADRSLWNSVREEEDAVLWINEVPE